MPPAFRFAATYQPQFKGCVPFHFSPHYVGREADLYAEVEAAFGAGR